MRFSGRLVFAGKWNKTTGQKKPWPAFGKEIPKHKLRLCISAFSPTASVCLCFTIIASLRENPARNPHLKSNRPSLFKGSQNSSDMIASSSNSVRSGKCGGEEAPSGSSGSGAVSYVAVLSLVESHPLYVFVAWLGKEQNNPLRRSFGALGQNLVSCTCTETILRPKGRIKLAYYGIIEWFGLEGTLKIIWFQPSCQKHIV